MSQEKPYKECPAAGCAGRGFEMGRDEDRQLHRRDCPKCNGFGILIRAGKIWRAMKSLFG